jgi:glutathione synthase/RimK-type ligase-like ATP-grasp enzyme
MRRAQLAAMLAAILTPDPADPDHASRWREVAEINAAPLRERGFTVEQHGWTSGANLTVYDLVMPLLVWGYPRAHEAWIERVSAWEAAGVRLRNPGPVLRWNADKTYLATLAERGAPVVPTLYADAPDETALTEAAARLGADRLVAKPRVSSTAWRTIRWSPGDPVTGGPEGAAMIQPFLPSIETTGETSLLFFGGRYSHAIRKRPQPGDFRVQPEFRGIITPHDPAPEELDAAERVLAAVEEELLYARVDLVRGEDGAPLLIELELIEPDLYLGYDPWRGAMFAEAAERFVLAGKAASTGA